MSLSYAQLEKRREALELVVAQLYDFVKEFDPDPGLVTEYLAHGDPVIFEEMKRAAKAAVRKYR